MVYNVACKDEKTRDAFFKKNEKGKVKFYDANDPVNSKLFEDVIRSEAAYKQKHGIADDSQNKQQESSKKGRKI